MSAAPVSGASPVSGADPVSGAAPVSGADPESGADPASGADPVSGAAPAGARRPPKTKKRNRVGEHQSLEEAISSWTQCTYFMKHKNRLCNIARSPGSMYCGNHRPEGEALPPRRAFEADYLGFDTSTVRRVPCPLDSSHTVYEHELATHVKICNVARREEMMKQQGYFVEECNCKSNLSQDGGEREPDPDRLLEKIKVCYESFVLPFLGEGPSDLDETVRAAVFDAVGGSATTFNKVRHCMQDAYLVQKMLDHGVVSRSDSRVEMFTKPVVVELGAGRGMLGLAIMSVIDKPCRSAPAASIDPDESSVSAVDHNGSRACRRPHLIMVERNGLRYKADKVLRERGMGHHRIRMDIRHCFLPKLPVVASRAEGCCPGLVLVAKHLCGLATDLSAFSIHSLFPPNRSEDSVESRGSRFQGLAIATCCHHACSWRDYVGADWFCSAQGFSEAEFNLMKQWSGWAHTIKQRSTQTVGRTSPSKYCKSGRDEKGGASGEEIDEEAGDINIYEHSAPVAESSIRPTEISSACMSETGKMIKRIFDQGRVEYLRSLGLVAKQVRYCDPSLSPECYMIVAVPQTGVA